MRLERLEPGRPTLGPGAWIGLLLLAGFGSAAAWLRLGLPLPACRLRELTGLPCATCGSTRMVEALLSGDLLGAVALNPLMFVVLTALATWAGSSIVRTALGLPGWRLVLRGGERFGALLLACSLIVAGWAYVIVNQA